MRKPNKILSNRKNNRFWSSEKIISLAAILISAGTLFTISYQNLLIRQQQYASARPHLTIKASNNKERNSFELHLTNNGTGPAFIENFKASYSGEEYDNWYSFYFGVLFEKGFNIQSTDILAYDFVIPSGESFKILGFYDRNSYQRIDSVWFHGGIMEISYKSLYGEEFVLNTDFIKSLGEQAQEAFEKYIDK